MTGLQAAILGGSVLILLVLALRLGLQRHLPRKLFPALWCAAAVRLLLPVSIPTRLSIWNLFERTSASAAAGTVSRTLLPFPDLTDGVAMASAPSASARVSPVSLVWLAGTVLLAAYVSIGCIFMGRGFRSARIAPCPSMDVLLDLFRFRKSPRIRATSSRRAPLTFGVLRPVILLPEGLAAESEPFRLVLAHELAHVKRRDCVRKLLFTVCLCLYWWNPLVWCMVILAGRDMELACDEAVLRALGPGCRKAYALTLLSMAARSPAPAPLTASFSGSSLSRRIRAIARFRPVSKWAGVCAAIVFALSACVFSTQAALPAPSGQKSVVPEPLQAAAIEASPSLPEAIEPDAPEALAEAEFPEKAPEMTVAKYVWPLENADAAVNDSFGWLEHPVSRTVSFHAGVDLDAPAGSNVLAVADGTVLKAEYHEAYGYFIQLEHEDGIQTLYAHLQELLAAPGDTVKQGQIIGLSGSSGWTTGPHLHLGVYINGEAVDPLAFLMTEDA